jgi:hypothetical protein
LSSLVVLYVSSWRAAVCRHFLMDVIPISILTCIFAIEVGFLAGNLSKVVWATSQNRNWIIIQVGDCASCASET